LLYQVIIPALQLFNCLCHRAPFQMKQVSTLNNVYNLLNGKGITWTGLFLS
jgi:hypothetical protein